MKSRIRVIAFLTFLILSFAVSTQAVVDQQKLDQALEKSQK